MREKTVTTFLLLALAVILYLSPPEVLIDWRLSFCSIYLSASAAARGAEPSESPDYARLESDRQRVEYLLSQLSLKNAEIASLKRRLRHVAEAQEFLPELRFQTASIIKLGNTRIGETLIINRGRQDEVRVGDAVLQGQSLVGTIARLGPRTSLLQLISSPGSLVAARTGTSRENCSIAGAGQNRAKVVFYHENVKAAQGEVLFTSGLTGNLPENIFVGVLAEAPGEGVEPGTFEASINLRADFSTLESLLLIRRVNQISSEVEDAERDR